MELRSFLFQGCLHRPTRRFGQQRRQAVAKRIYRFYFETTINQIIGVFAADKPASDDAHLFHVISGNDGTKISVVQQIIDGIDQFQPVALNRGAYHLCTHGQNQLAVVDDSLGITHLDQLVLGINFTHLGHSPDTGFKLTRHAARVRLG